MAHGLHESHFAHLGTNFEYISNKIQELLVQIMFSFVKHRTFYSGPPELNEPSQSNQAYLLFWV